MLNSALNITNNNVTKMLALPAVVVILGGTRSRASHFSVAGGDGKNHGRAGARLSDRKLRHSIVFDNAGSREKKREPFSL